MGRTALICVLVALFALPARAGAALPGRNGLIAFTSTFEPTSCGEHSCEAEVLRLHTVRPSGRTLRRISICDDAWACEDVAPAWSPDGSRIAFAHDEGLWVMGADGTGAHEVGHFDAEDPAWSPGGGRIAFSEFNDAGESIATVRPDGSGFRRLTRGAWDTQASWSSRGQIAFTHDVPGTTRLSVVTIRARDGRVVARLRRRFGVSDPDFSPDGRLLAVDRTPGGLLVARPDGSDARSLVRGGASPAWSPDGRFVAYNTDYPGRLDIWIARADGSHAHPVGYDRSQADPRDGDDPDYFGPSWQPLPR
jgi:Tol biopolymer transport system component